MSATWTRYDNLDWIYDMKPLGILDSVWSIAIMY